MTHRLNRDVALFQGGQLLSSAGSESTTIAYALVVLALTNSPLKAGLVTFARVLPFVLFGLLAGAAADRFDRRAMMLGADGVRALAVAGLGVALLVDRVALWQVVLVAFIEGTGSTFFKPAAMGALRSVVPTIQLPAAATAQQACIATAQIAGPPLGGALLGLGRAVPFLADAASYMFSALSLLLIRTPFQHERAIDRQPLPAAVHEGIRFLWHQPFLRATALLYAVSNFIGTGMLLVVVVVGEREGLTSGEIGLLLGAFSVCVLAGSLASPLLRRTLPTRTIVLLELWTWLGLVLFVLWPSVYVLVGSMLLSALAIPVTDSVVISHRLAITPNHLVGRVESVRSTMALLMVPLGPLAGGLLLTALPATATVATFAGLGLLLALWATLRSNVFCNLAPIGESDHAGTTAS